MIITDVSPDSEYESEDCSSIYVITAVLVSDLSTSPWMCKELKRRGFKVIHGKTKNSELVRIGGVRVRNLKSESYENYTGGNEDLGINFHEMEGALLPSTLTLISWGSWELIDEE